MRKSQRVKRVHVDDPDGYVVSINYGDELCPYRTLEDAIWYAKAALREGVESAQVWHNERNEDGYSCAVDPNKECEWSGHQRDRNEVPAPDWMDRYS